MHRDPLLNLLERHLARVPEDHVRVDHVRQFVRANQNCFERSNLEGHITASAWILDARREHFLLTHHKKLNRWLQLGGHVDGDPDVLRAALREAREESGLGDLLVPRIDGQIVPLDVDVHVIPARKDEPAHLHHDIRFLFIATRDEIRVAEAESHGLAWFAHERLEAVVDEPSMLRLGHRTIAMLKGPLDLVRAPY